MIKTYSELITIERFKDRFEYLKIGNDVGKKTFGGHRYLNQYLYNCREWKSIRQKVVIRDWGCDLAHKDHPISGKMVLVHHINPITIEDILNRNPCVFDLENLISTEFNTHNAIHYGDASLLPEKFIERKKDDTCPWR